MRAWLNLRYTVSERVKAYTRGLRALGYTVMNTASMQPAEGDILVTWNRVGIGEASAKVFESRGLPVLVTENATWGNDFAGQRWYTIARNRHNTAGCFPVGSAARWDDLQIPLAPFRAGGETVILPQRGIGSPPTAMPARWLDTVRKQGRVRVHPGTRACVPLEEDLAQAGHVITWGSGAAVKALVMGIRVTSHMPDWIGEQDNTEVGRLAMFRRLAWAQWRLAEIESGEAFARLLG